MRRVLTAMVCAALLPPAVAACGSSGGSAETPAATDTGVPGGAGDAREGVAIYTSNCAGCNGTDGSGGSGPDLRSKDDVDKVVAHVTNDGANMPAFEGPLTAAEIQSVAEYVANGYKQAARRASRTQAGPGARSRCPAPFAGGLGHRPWDIIEAVT
jgi:cytochrome c551